MAAKIPVVLLPGGTHGIYTLMPALTRAWTDMLAGRLGGIVPGGTSALPAMARRVLAEAPPRFALAGLSMGGYLAQEVMRQAPERVTRLALLDTSARADTLERTA